MSIFVREWNCAQIEQVPDEKGKQSCQEKALTAEHKQDIPKRPERQSQHQSEDLAPTDIILPQKQPTKQRQRRHNQRLGAHRKNISADEFAGEISYRRKDENTKRQLTRHL